MEFSKGGHGQWGPCAGTMPPSGSSEKSWSEAKIQQQVSRSNFTLPEQALHLVAISAFQRVAKPEEDIPAPDPNFFPKKL